MKMRMIKSPEEIELIKQGARIADLGGEAVVKAIKEGAAEHEIALASTNAMVKEIADTYPHSEIRDSKFQLFILLKFLYSFSFCFLGVFNYKKKCGAQGCPHPRPHRGGLGQIPGPESRSTKVPIVADSEKIRAFRLYFVKLELKTSQRPVKIRKSIKRSNLKLKIETLLNSQAFSQPFIRHEVLPRN